MIKDNPILRLLGLHLLAVFFAMLNISNVEIAGFSGALPLFDVMIIFYFAVFRNVFSVWFLFILGIWADALNGDPLGLTALCYILLTKFFVALNDRTMMRENFYQILQQFVAFCFLFLLIKWSILSVFNRAAYTVVTPLLQIILSSLFYVLLHKFLTHISSQIPERD